MSPGLHSALYDTVASQLRIMSPCILLAVRVGPIASTFVSDKSACRVLSSHFRCAVQQLVNGIQLARMTTTKRFIRPVLSPAVSSLVVRVNHNW